MVDGRADIRDLRADGRFAEYLDDPFTPFVGRDALTDDVDVAIVGAGIAGVLLGAELRKVGIRRIRLIEEFRRLFFRKSYV